MNRFASINQWTDLAKQRRNAKPFSMLRSQISLTSFVGFLLLSLVAVAWSQGGEGGAAAKTKTPPAIEVDDCRIKSPKEVILAFDRPGILGVLSVDEGDEIESGTLIASLKDDVARAALKVARVQADSDVEIVYAELAAKVAKTEHEAMKFANQIKAGTIPDIEVQRAKLNYEKTEAEVEKAKHNQQTLIAKRDEAAVQLDTYKLEAPFTGVVTKVHLVKGASVKQGDPVIEIVNTSKVRVEGSILISEAMLVKAGCKVEIKLIGENIGTALASRIFAGKIGFVDPAKVLAVGEHVRIWAEVDNPDGLLRDGLRATMKIQPVSSND